jgi:lysophospholipase L1-like esterase
MKTFVLSLTLLLALTFTQPLYADLAKSEISVVSGQKIAFLGDSITAAGARSGGYCKLVIDGLKKQGIDAKPVFAGISGHKSDQMLARLEKDVLSKKPDWMTLSCGVNDVWHGKNGVKLPEYKVNITAIVDRAQAQGVKVMLLTSTMIRENQSESLNQQLLPYNGFLKKLAKEKGCLFADLNTQMQQALKKFPKDAPKGKQLTSDGVHMNPFGNYMMAKGVLKAFGVAESKFPALVNGWKDIPGAKTIRFHISLSMSQNEYEQLQRKVDKSLHQMFQDFLNQKKEELLKKYKEG